MTLVLSDVPEVTSLIMKDPQRFLDLAGSPERYVARWTEKPDEKVSKSAPSGSSQPAIPVILDTHCYEECAVSSGVSTGSKRWITYKAIA